MSRAAANDNGLGTGNNGTIETYRSPVGVMGFSSRHGCNFTTGLLTSAVSVFIASLPVCIEYGNPNRCTPDPARQLLRAN